MDERKAGAAALIGSVAGMLATMATHPTGADVLAGGHAAAVARVSHSLAVAATPLAVYGFFVLTKRLRGAPNLAALALVVYGLAAMAAVMAAVVSGFIAPRVARGLAAATGPEREMILATFHFAGHVNRAFAGVYVMASSAAIALWSLALLRTRRAPLAGAFGLLVSGATAAALVTSHVRLDVHGFGAIVLAQGVWTVAAAVMLARMEE